MRFALTLAVALIFAGTAPGFAAAPVIGAIPDLQIGDLEDNPGGTDNNYFVFTNAFQFSTKVSDPDTSAGMLLWSFSEYYPPGSPYLDGAPADAGPAQQQFQINGKNPIAVGAGAIATETGNGFPNAKAPGANRLNASTDYASFRDILFSPTNQTAPFTPAVNVAQGAWSATAGKNVVFYVADPEGNLDDAIIRVKTEDGDFDKISLSFPTGIDQGGPPANNPFVGWIESGLNSNTGSAVLGNNDDVDRTDNTLAQYESNQGEPTTTATDLGTIVRSSSARYRVLGWVNTTGMPYPGAGSYVRGKFYIYTSNGSGDATNAYPNFRARIQHGGAYVGVTNYQYAKTGETGGTGGDFPYALNEAGGVGTAAENASGQYFKPSRTPGKPSLYRVDLDPVDVPAAATRNILPVFESYAFNDPANATIFLSQITVGFFPALTDGAGTPIMNYNAATGAGAFTVNFGGIHAEGDLTFGYKQNIFAFSGQQATGTNTSGAGSTGLEIDTGATNPAYTNRFVVGIADVLATANASRPRIAPGKYYRARFYATSDVPTTAASTGTQRQGNLRFRLQTASNVINTYQEFVGAKNTSENTAAGAPGSAQNNIYRDCVIAGQAMPGSNSVNPDKDNTLEPTNASYNGGWYTVLLPTPLDGDIRRDVDPAGVVSATTFGTLFSEPGAGSASASLKDIKAGMDVYTNPLNLKLGATTFNNYYDANRGKVSLTAVKIYEYDASTVTDDGGYVY